MLANILLGIKESRQIKPKNEKRENMKGTSLHIISKNIIFI